MVAMGGSYAVQGSGEDHPPRLPEAAGSGGAAPNPPPRGMIPLGLPHGEAGGDRDVRKTQETAVGVVLGLALGGGLAWQIGRALWAMCAGGR